MSHPLLDRLNKISRRARLVALAHAALRCGGVLVAAFFLGCLADYLFRFYDPVVRGLVSTAVLVALGWASFRYLLPAIAARFSDLQVARRVERRFPQLGDRLSSTVAFLHQEADDPTAGSYELRKAVVAETLSEVEQLNLGECIDGRAAERGTWLWSIPLGLLVVTACVLDPPSAAFAAKRLIAPWSQQHWPRRNHLEFVDAPERLAEGSDFNVEVIDRNDQMPANVFLSIKYDDDSPPQRREFTFAGGKLVARLNNVSRSFRYRATGGDDDTMEWRDLAVVKPPRLTDYRVEIIPPAYANWPTAVSDGEIRALSGSSVVLQGEVDRGLKSIRLRFEPERRADDEGETPPGPPGLRILGDEDRLFASPAAGQEGVWRTTRSGAYWLEFIDSRGVASAKEARWEVRVAPDAPPAVALSESSANRYVTRNAQAAIKALAKDDLAIRDVQLLVKRSDAEDAPEEAVSLFAGPERAAPQSQPEARGDERSVEHLWDLTAVPGLKPGDTLEYVVAAHDYLGQQGRSAAQRLTIISADEFEDRIGQRQTYILGQLAEALRMQREARSQVKALEIQWDKTRAFSRQDGDQLQSAELNQRQVSRLISGPNDGVRSLISTLLEDVENNRLDSPELQRRMQDLLSILDGLTRAELPAVQRHLLEGLKDVRPLVQPLVEAQKTPVPEAVAKTLKSAGGDQDKVIEKLESVLGELTQWDSYRRFAREVHRIQRDHEQLQQQTDAARLNTLTRNLQELTPQEQADVARLSQQQLELARRMDKLQTRMKKMSDELKESDPLAAETLSDGVQTARRSAVSGQMREGARRIGANQMGQASNHQQEAAQGLEDLMNVLTNRREDELGRRVRKMQEAAGDLGNLRRREQELQSKMKQAGAQSDPERKKRELQRLAKQQEQLAQEAQQLARRLQRLQAQKPGDSVSKASQGMQGSSQAGRQGDAKQAEHQAQKALEELDKAQQQLQQQVEQTRQQLFFEQLARLEQVIAGLLLQQESILGVTTELDQVKQTEGELQREQQASLRNLADHQRQLGVESSRLGEKVARAEAFALSLQGAAREMTRAAGFLEQFDTTNAKVAETHAHTRLKQLQEALKPEPPDESQRPSEQGKPGQGGEPPPPAEAIQQLAQLKLVKLMQVEVNRRTLELEKLGQNQPLTEEQQREYDDLAEEQGRLADIVLNLIQSQDNPNNDLPDAPADPALDELDQALEKSLR